MNQDEMKRAAAHAALAYVPNDGQRHVIGVGTGSTANHFIALLPEIRTRVKGAVASSEQSAALLRAQGIALFDLNHVEHLAVYVDGADEIDAQGCMIKGGGGALTREKIVAACARQFVCIADTSKQVAVLGAFALPVEVIPMAQSYVARCLAKLGGKPVLRMRNETPYVTDNGNLIVDVQGLSITQPRELEVIINQIVGVVTVGLFAQRGADVALLGSANGVIKIEYEKTK